MTADTTLPVRSPADLIAAVPYVLGFHPTDSLTVVAVRGTRVIFAARLDLPAPQTPEDETRAEALHVAAVVARQNVDGVTVIGYGAAERVTPAVRRLAEAVRAQDISVLDELRVTDGRFWSYLCRDATCCPPEGRACDTASSAVAAAATYAGQVALPDRQSLADLLKPVTGPPREAMVAATARALRRLADLTAGLPAPRPDAVVPPVSADDGGVPRVSADDGGVPRVSADDGGAPSAPAAPSSPGAGSAGPAVIRAGRAAVRAAVRRHRDGGQLTDDEVAWLGVLLTQLPVRDHAWERIDRSEWHVPLWTDVLRRVEPIYVPAPACLLSFAAWRSGDGALACVAVDRARRQDPAYPMAGLLGDVLRYALPPSAVDDWPPAEGRHPRAPRRHRRRAIGT